MTSDTDICSAVLDQHHLMRVAFARLDEILTTDPPDDERASHEWRELRQLLDAHAEAEELLFYPLLVAAGREEVVDETRDAVGDHNDIRDSCDEVDECAPCSPGWWAALLRTREVNSRHMAEEERGPLADGRAWIPPELRLEAGQRWSAYMATRVQALARSSEDKDPAAYVAEQLERTQPPVDP
jgi:hypothetical protein